MRRTLSHETQNALSNIDTILPALATKVVVVLLDYGMFSTAFAIDLYLQQLREFRRAAMVA